MTISAYNVSTKLFADSGVALYGGDLNAALGDVKALIPTGTGSYTLPPATGTTLGGVKPGAGLVLASDGGLTSTALQPSGTLTSGHLLVVASNGTSVQDGGAVPTAVSPVTATVLTTIADTDFVPWYDASGADYVVQPPSITTYLAGKLSRFTKAVSVAPMTVAYAASVTVDPTLSNQIRIGTLTGALALANPSTLVSGNDGIQFEITLKQDATGGRAVTLGTMFVLAVGDTIPTTANCVCRIGCTWNAVDGVIRCAVSKVWGS